MKNQEDPQIQYAIKLLSAVQSVFEETSDNYIGMKELQEGDNLTHFFHALANIVPSRVFNQITGEEVSTLEFNHVANKLVFQYANKAKQGEEKG